MKKITVVGGGNAGCFTALYCAWMDKQKDFEVDGKKYANKSLKQYYKGMYEQ